MLRPLAVLIALSCVAAVAGCGGGSATVPRHSPPPPGALVPSIGRSITAQLEAVARDAGDWPAAIPRSGGDAWRAPLAARAAGLRRQIDALLPGVPARTGASEQAVVRARLIELRAVLRSVRAPALNRATATLLAGEIVARAVDLRTRIQRGRLTDMTPGSPQQRIHAVDGALFRARLALALGDQTGASAAVADAARAAQRLRADLGGAWATVAGGLADAARAVASGNPVALGRARGSVAGRLAVDAYGLSLEAVRHSNGAAAARWLAAEDLGPMAGARTVAADAGRSVARQAAGRLGVRATLTAVQRDQLDAFQRRALALVQQAGLAAYQGDAADRAQDAARAAAYWAVLAPSARAKLGGASTAATARALGSLSAASAAAVAWKIDGPVQTATRSLSAFTAAPLTAAERTTRVEQLIRYARFESTHICGVAASPVADPGEGAGAAPTLPRLANDIRPGLTPAAQARLDRAIAALTRLPSAAGVGAEDVPSPNFVSADARRLCAAADADLQAAFPRAWRAVGESTDFDEIERYLARMILAVKARDYPAAEAARARAYAAFEFGAELRLRAYDPAIASRVEGLFWAGAPDGPDLVDLISHHASAGKVEARRTDITTALEQGRISLQRAKSHTATMLNSAVVVFREGLEAALILAALSASFAAGGRRWGRPLVIGMLAALPATLVTWILTSAVVKSLAGFGLQLEAGLDLVAFVVLAIIMAWFFQRFCWTRFVAKTHARNRRFLRRRDGSELVGASVALAVFGFMIIYREGFETVVYLQALKLGAAGGAVLAGAALGLAVTLGLAVLMLRLRRRLPYRRIVVVTAVAIGALLVILAGQGARAFQGAGWLGITPLDWHIPLWAGQWLGVYPSVETLAAQVLTAAAIPLGAELMRRRRDKRQQRIMAARKHSAPRPAVTVVHR